MKDEERYEKRTDEQIEKFMRKFNSKYPLNKYDIEREDIGGIEEVLEQFDGFRAGITNPDMYSFMGIRPPNGFILDGPPGTGKTFVAKYLAKDVGARFVDMPLNQYESQWVGQAASNLSRIIGDMREYNHVTDEKILLFFDEAEEAFKDRSLGGWHGPRVNVLLREMDGLGNNRGVIFGAATNHVDKVDSALLRAGRLDYVINMPTYDAERLGGVFLATANRINRKSPHHSPYAVTNEEARGLGVMAAAKNLTPSDINEIYRRAGEKKVHQMITKKEMELFLPEDYHVVGVDLEREIESYKRSAKKRVGF